MAEAVAEPQTAAPEQKNEAPTNGNAETSNGVAEKSNGDAAHNGKIEKNIADGKDGDQRHPDRRNPDSRDDRDDERKDKRNHDRNDNRRGGGRGGGRGRGFRGGGRGRGRGGGGDGGFRGNNHGRNVRTRFQREEESSDATEIRRQVEFYFSDSNLPIDRFLLEETGGPANKPFPLKTIHNFKRMRHFQPFSAVVEAVKGSTFLEVNDKDEVYRKVPLDERFTLDVAKNNELLTSSSMARSIYAKGFGKEEEKTAFDIEE
jgi:lupus La protein